MSAAKQLTLYTTPPRASLVAEENGLLRQELLRARQERVDLIRQLSSLQCVTDTALKRLEEMQGRIEIRQHQHQRQQPLPRGSGNIGEVRDEDVVLKSTLLEHQLQQQQHRHESVVRGLRQELSLQEGRYARALSDLRNQRAQQQLLQQINPPAAMTATPSASALSHHDESKPKLPVASAQVTAPQLMFPSSSYTSPQRQQVGEVSPTALSPLSPEQHQHDHSRNQQLSAASPSCPYPTLMAILSPYINDQQLKSSSSALLTLFPPAPSLPPAPPPPAHNCVHKQNVASETHHTPTKPVDVHALLRDTRTGEDMLLDVGGARGSAGADVESPGFFHYTSTTATNDSGSPTNHQKLNEYYRRVLHNIFYKKPPPSQCTSYDQHQRHSNSATPEHPPRTQSRHDVPTAVETPASDKSKPNFSDDDSRGENGTNTATTTQLQTPEYRSSGATTRSQTHTSTSPLMNNNPIDSPIAPPITSRFDTLHHQRLPSNESLTSCTGAAPLLEHFSTHNSSTANTTDVITAYRDAFKSIRDAIDGRLTNNSVSIDNAALHSISHSKRYGVTDKDINHDHQRDGNSQLRKSLPDSWNRSVNSNYELYGESNHYHQNEVNDNDADENDNPASYKYDQTQSSPHHQHTTVDDDHSHHRSPYIDNFPSHQSSRSLLLHRPQHFYNHHNQIPHHQYHSYNRYYDNESSNGEYEQNAQSGAHSRHLSAVRRNESPTAFNVHAHRRLTRSADPAANVPAAVEGGYAVAAAGSKADDPYRSCVVPMDVTAVLVRDTLERVVEQNTEQEQEYFNLHRQRDEHEHDRQGHGYSTGSDHSSNRRRMITAAAASAPPAARSARSLLKSPFQPSRALQNSLLESRVASPDMATSTVTTTKLHMPLHRQMTARSPKSDSEAVITINPKTSPLRVSRWSM